MHITFTEGTQIHLNARDIKTLQGSQRILSAIERFEASEGETASDQIGFLLARLSEGVLNVVAASVKE